MLLHRLVIRAAFFVAALCGVLFFETVYAAPVIYDFESLNTGNLAGQDNWAKQSFTTEASVVNGSGSNNTQVLRTSSGTGIWYRTNDAAFSFPVHSAAVTEAIMQIDIRYANIGTSDYFFALGAGNGAAANRGPAFGIGMGGNFLIREFGGTITDPLNLSVPASVQEGDWLRLQHVIDFTANSGNGAGRLFYQNLTKSDPGFTEFTTAPVNLKITEMNAGIQDPATWNTMVVVLSGSGYGTNAQFDNLTANVPKPPSLVYTFEGLTDGSLTGQDGWTPYLSNSAFNVTDGLGANTSKVAVGSVSPSFSVRENDVDWHFAPHSGDIAAIQYDLRFQRGNGENSGVYFGLATDLDSTEGINNFNERGPAFGILRSQFGIQHLGSDVDFDLLGRPDDNFGVAEGDWLRVQMVIDTTDSADGLATLYFQNLTKGTGWTQVNSTPVGLALTTRYGGTYAAMQNPENWDTMMMVRAATVDLQVDNLVPNAVPVPEPATLISGLLGVLGFGLTRRRRVKS